MEKLGLRPTEANFVVDDQKDEKLITDKTSLESRIKILTHRSEMVIVKQLAVTAICIQIA